MSQLFTSGAQSVGASASASVLPMNIQGLFALRAIFYRLIGPAPKEMECAFCVTAAKQTARTVGRTFADEVKKY